MGVAGVFGVIVWVYFWAIFVEIAMFMANLKDLAVWGSEDSLIRSWVAAIFPWSLDYGGGEGGLPALYIDVLLLGFFAIPHSIFPRPAVKKALGEPAALAKGTSVYRTLYVLQSTVALHLLMYFWQPVSQAMLWDLLKNDSSIVMSLACFAPYLFGVVWTVTSLFAIDHFELFGIKQSCNKDLMKDWFGVDVSGKLIARFHYKLVRHPIMTGFFILFFLIPTMTINHMFFSISCTAYILLAVTFLEEPDMRSYFPGEYDDYAKQVPAYCPFACGKKVQARSRKQQCLLASVE